MVDFTTREMWNRIHEARAMWVGVTHPCATPSTTQLFAFPSQGVTNNLIQYH